MVNRPSKLKRYADLDRQVEWSEISQTSDALTLELPAGVTMHKTGLNIDVRLEYEVWHKVGADLLTLRTSARWAIGDWWAFGFHTYGSRKKFAAEAKSLPFKLGTLMNYGTVSRCVPISLRNEALTWSHHKVVAGLAHEEQRKWLAKAASGKKWSVKFLEQKLYDSQRQERDDNPIKQASYLAEIFLDQAQRAQSAMNWDTNSLLLLDDAMLTRMAEAAEMTEAIWAKRRVLIEKIKKDDRYRKRDRVRLGSVNEGTGQSATH